MDLLTFTRVIAAAGLALGGAGILLQIKEIMARPFKKDLSRPRGSVGRGILYAFTLGMAPWEKESTRLHWIAYIRGILFHVGIFTALGILLAALTAPGWQWLEGLPPAIQALAALVAGSGALAGLAGIAIRLRGANERALSLPDDYFSVLLTSLFIALAALSLPLPGLLPVFLVVAGGMAVYIPFSKIRHCVYFFYSKFFFGLHFGRRGVIGQPKNETFE